MNALRGRGRELGELERLIAGAAGGAGAVVEIEGPPGIGKSALLAAAAEMGTARGMTVAAGHADELDQISPWGMLLEAFTSGSSAIADRAAVLAAGTGRLDQRGMILEGFRVSLEAAASRQPVLVLLDDLQWADPETVSALGWLPAQLFSYPIVWLLARRPLPVSPPLEVLEHRLSAGGADRWRVGPLDEAAAAELAADVVGSGIGQRTGELLRVSGGNPLFMLEVLRLMNERGGRADALDAAGRDVLASGESSLQAIVGAHLRSVSNPTVELLKVASVLGQQFAPSEVRDLAGRTGARLLSAVEEAITSGILVETGEDLAFRHDVFRQVLYSNIPATLRRSLHAEAAVVLRRHGASATRLAHQLVIGAQAGDPEAVASLGEAVGELFGTSPWAAADLALRLVDLAPPDSEARSAAVGMAVALLGWAGRMDEALELGEGFLEGRSLPAAVEADIELGIRRAWLTRANRPYPRRVPEHLLGAPEVPATVRANLLAFEQVGPIGEADFVRSDEALERAAELLFGVGSVLDAFGVVGLWITSALLQGRFLSALDRARRDLHLVGPAGPMGEAMIDAMIAMSLMGVGRFGEALEMLGRAQVAGDESGFLFYQAYCRAFRIGVLIETGRLDDARAEASTASDEAILSGNYSMAGLALAELVESLVRLGDLDGAANALRQLAQYQEGEVIARDESFWATALVADAQGRAAVVQGALRSLAGDLAKGSFAIATRHGGRLPQIVRLALKHGEPDVARQAAGAAARLPELNPGEALLEQVDLHARGLLEGDVGLLRLAYDRSQKTEPRLLHAIVAEDLGGALAAAGSRAEAVTALDESLVCFSEMGAPADAARVRARLRALGVRRRQVAAGRPVRGWASLTQAEQSVARLVGRGLSNRAVAEDLSVSPDTVNTHLRHIFTKLDIRSRSQLAAILASHERPPAATIGVGKKGPG